VPLLRALLALPVSTSAARALDGRPAALLFALAPPLAAGAYLLARGCRAEDAAATAAAILLAELFAGLGGVAALGAAASFAGARRASFGRLPSCVAFAAWFALLMAALTALLSAFGPFAALFAALVLLAWGVAWGAGRILAEGGGDLGRALVASCAGAAGAIAGLALAAAVARAQLVAVGPEVAGGATGGIPLRTLVLQRADAEGGRVFFRFGGAWGGAAEGGPR
jgi:hypothetical protein